jgi:hypothetical protein
VIVNENSVSHQSSMDLFRYGWIHLQTVIVVNENEPNWAQPGTTGSGRNRQRGATCIKADSGSLARLQWSSVVKILIIYIYINHCQGQPARNNGVYHPEPNS